MSYFVSSIHNCRLYFQVKLKLGSSVSWTTLDYNTRRVEEGDRRSKNTPLIDIVHLTRLTNFYLDIYESTSVDSAISFNLRAVINRVASMFQT
jgi:hypothetical protein